MYGSIAWNFVIAAFSSMLTFMISFFDNLFMTALIQGLYSFAVMFLVAFVFRFIIGLLLSLNIPANTELDFSEPPVDLVTGQNVSLQTPDADQYLQDIIKQNYANATDSGAADQFQPLNPTQLSTAPETQADNLVEAVRSSLRQQ